MPDDAGRVFLSYRREETRHLAGRLADRLADRFGSAQVFMDVDTIEPGVDFAAAITRAVGSCDVLVAMIGNSWLTITDRYGHRKLDNPDDFVVLEIQAALDRSIRLIPVLVDGADMPRPDDLPKVLRGLARRNAVRLDHETFRSDAGHLLTAIERILATDPHVSTGEAADGKSNSQTGRNITSSSTPARPLPAADASYLEPSISRTMPKRPAANKSQDRSSVEPSTPSTFNREGDRSRQDRHQILPMPRVVLRIALWWCTFILATLILASLAVSIGAMVIFVLLFGGVVLLLRREIIAQRHILERAAADQPGHAVPGENAVSRRHVIRVSICLLIAVVVFAVILA